MPVQTRKTIRKHLQNVALNCGHVRETNRQHQEATLPAKKMKLTDHINALAQLEKEEEEWKQNFIKKHIAKLAKAEEEMAKAKEKQTEAEEKQAKAEEILAKAVKKLVKTEGKLAKAEAKLVDEKMGQLKKFVAEKEELEKAKEKQTEAEERQANAEKKQAETEKKLERWKKIVTEKLEIRPTRRIIRLTIPNCAKRFAESKFTIFSDPIEAVAGFKWRLIAVKSDDETEKDRLGLYLCSIPPNTEEEEEYSLQVNCRFRVIHQRSFGNGKDIEWKLFRCKFDRHRNQWGLLMATFKDLLSVEMGYLLWNCITLEVDFFIKKAITFCGEF